MHPRAYQTQEPPATVLFNPRFVAQQPGNNPPPIRGHVRDPPPPPPPSSGAMENVAKTAALIGRRGYNDTWQEAWEWGGEPRRGKKKGKEKRGER